VEAANRASEFPSAARILRDGDLQAIPMVADSLILEPWTEEEIARGEAEGAAQWERLGVEMDEE